MTSGAERSVQAFRGAREAEPMWILIIYILIVVAAYSITLSARASGNIGS
jgi:hypothetical protein